jgi:hypothetical protein
MRTLAPPYDSLGRAGARLGIIPVVSPLPPGAVEAIAAAHAWLEVNSGWAPPDPDTLAELVADGVCRCPDDCLVAPEAWCEHGLASWWLILGALPR